MSTVALANVSKVFEDGTVAVDNVSLEVNKGEFLVLLGPSGCGKSTLLRMVAGLEPLTAGNVIIDGEVADDLTPRERGVAMIFQDYGLYPHMNVRDNIGFPLRIAGIEPKSRGERVTDVAGALGIDDVLGRRPAHLSGGQRQRVAMGRAIIRRPSLFLMDEPLSNLDSGLRAQLRAEISSLVRELGVTTIYVTHDQAEALTMADRVAILRRGVLQDVGTPTDVYRRPGTLFVATFLGSPKMNLVEAQVFVHLDRYIALHLGDQALYLPWNDMRARQVSHYHGEKVVIGFRAEALTPVAADAQGDVLRGRVRYIEHHGHESLAFVDVGAMAISLDEYGPPAEANGHGGRIGRVGGLFRRAAKVEAAPSAEVGSDGNGRAGNGRTAAGVLEQSGRHARLPAELAVRLQPYPSLRVGEPMAVGVRMDQLHFFDPRGNRIDVGWR
ncbi:MAG TPA: ATP-binding cassette domain-containing protein [Micromonosporaceae bacterium]